MSSKFRERFQNVQRRPNFRWTHSVQMPVYHCVSQVWGIKNWYRLWDVGLVLVPVFSFQFAALYVVGSIILCSAIVLWKLSQSFIDTSAAAYWLEMPGELAVAGIPGPTVLNWSQNIISRTMLFICLAAEVWWSVIPRQRFSGNARLVRCTPLWSPPHQRMGLTIIATFADGWAKLNCVCKSIIHLFPSPSRHVSRCLVDIFVHMQYVS